jgi:N-hydroxyarylamine O-acetyltransferase
MDRSPEMPGFDLGAYCRRIGIESPTASDRESLIAMSEAHATTIPYENLEIQLGREMSLEEVDLERLLVAGKRGGYCFQMNLLFARALESVGFDVSLSQGRVWLTSPDVVPPPAHLILRVELDGEPWLVDVGFGGGGMRRPIPMCAGEESLQGGRRYRLRDAAGFGLMFERFEGGSWIPQFSFDQRPCERVDFVHSNYFLSHSPESFFVQHRICAIATEAGEKTLFDTNLRIREGDDIEDTTLEEGPEVLEALREHFGIELAATDVLRPAC